MSELSNYSLCIAWFYMFSIYDQVSFEKDVHSMH